MERNQSKWSRNIYFGLAILGAAVGLGNLWRFPYIAYENGGGSFFIPFVACYLLVGLPVILLEFGLGQWAKGSIGEAFKKRSHRTTWIGWWVLVNSFIIVGYYTIIMAWCLNYAIYSIQTEWGSDTKTFFFNEVSRLSTSPLDVGGVNFITIASLAAVWICTFFVLKHGLKTLSKILVFTVPIPFLLIVVLATRSIGFPGGLDGVKYFFIPETSKLLDINVWSAAASQVILSLSLGMGQMVAYSSMKKNTTGNLKMGLFLISGDFLFSLFAGIAVFATFGAMQYQLGQPMTVGNELTGPGLAFITYPAAISSLPYAPLWGFLFFFMLVMLGIDSVFAVVEANITDLKTIFPKISKTKLIGYFCLASFLIAIPFATGAGLYWLDIVDHWVGYFAIFSIFILQCICFAGSNKIKEIAKSIGPWLKGAYFKAWRIWLLIFLPLFIGGFLIYQLSNEFILPYSNYPWISIIIGGWTVFFLVILIAILISKKHNKV